MKISALLLVAGLMVSPAFAQLSGEYQASYGSARSVQLNATGFGNATQGDPDYTNGSELDAAFVRGDASYAYMLFTGNLESNFNKLEVFIDTGAAGGQSSVNGTGVGQLNNINGFTFDTGFHANIWLSATCGTNGGTGMFALFVDGAVLGAGGATGGYLGTNNGTGGALSGGSNILNALVALNNSNTSGVSGSSASDALLATTGVEIAIPWATLGINPGDTFRIMAFINGQNHDYASNQFLGSLPAGTGNLGGDGSGGYNGSVGQLNMNNFAGEQYFTVPTPGAAALLGLGGLAAFRRRRA